MIDTGYRIPFYSMPPVSFSNNNKSSLANAGSVEEAISELLLTNRVFETDAISHNVNPLSLSVQSSGKKRLILDLRLIMSTCRRRELSLKTGRFEFFGCRSFHLFI